MQPSDDISRFIEIILILPEIHTAGHLPPVQINAIQRIYEPLPNTHILLEILVIFNLGYLLHRVEFDGLARYSAHPLALVYPLHLDACVEAQRQSAPISIFFGLFELLREVVFEFMGALDVMIDVCFAFFSKIFDSSLEILRRVFYLEEDANRFLTETH